MSRSMLRISVAVGGVKLSGLVLSLAIAAFLARHLGPSDYGVYSYALSVVFLLAVPLHLALPTLLLREVSIRVEEGKAIFSHSSLAWVAKAFLLLSFACFISSVGIGEASHHFFGSELGNLGVTIVTVILAMAVGLVLISSALFRSAGKAVLGQALDAVIRPLFFLALLLMFMHDASVVGVITFQIVSVILALVSVFPFLRKIMINSPDPGEKEERVDRLRDLCSFTGVAATSVLVGQIDLLMLGVFVSSQEVGAYKVALQGASLVAFALSAVNIVAAPKFAQLQAISDTRSMQKLVTLCARIAFFAALLALGILWVFGQMLITKIFGPAYSLAFMPLMVLAVGQAVNALFGPTSQLLVMTGHEKFVTRAFLYGALLSGLACLVLVPKWGAAGAAVSAAASVLTWNVMLAYRIRKELGIRVSVL